ncbi:GAD-like domain-containing protein [Nocardia asteroides]
MAQVIGHLGKPCSTVPAEDRVVDRYSGIVPELVQDVWRVAGFSGYADGLLWLCNPEEWQPGSRRMDLRPTTSVS